MPCHCVLYTLVANSTYFCCRLVAINVSSCVHFAAAFLSHLLAVLIFLVESSISITAMRSRISSKLIFASWVWCTGRVLRGVLIGLVFVSLLFGVPQRHYDSFLIFSERVANRLFVSFHSDDSVVFSELSYPGTAFFFFFLCFWFLTCVR